MTDTAGGTLVTRHSQEGVKPPNGEVLETEEGYAAAKMSREAEGEEKEKKKEEEEAEKNIKEHGEGAGNGSSEEKRWSEEGWVGWINYQDNKGWTEEEVREVHLKDKEDRATNWWGGTELDRQPDVDDKDGKEHKYDLPRGTRAGLGNRMAEWSYNRWTPRFVVARNWQSHWKYRKWEKTQKQLWPSEMEREQAQWETSVKWNEECQK